MALIIAKTLDMGVFDNGTVITVGLEEWSVYVNWRIVSLHVADWFLKYKLKKKVIRPTKALRNEAGAPDIQGPFHLSEFPIIMRISLLIKTIQPDQSNPK